MKAIFLIFGFLLINNFSFCQIDQFKEANEAFLQKDFTTAITSYTSILEEGFVSPDLYLNLGNAYLESNDLSHAILTYERGLKNYNGHDGLLKNLSIAQKKIAFQITEIPDFLPVRYWRIFCKALSSSGWAILQLLLLIGIVFGIRYWLFSEKRSNKSTAFYGLLITVFLFILTCIAGYNRYKMETQNSHGIVMVSNTSLHTSASEKSDIVYELSPGVKVRILDQITGFYKVELLDKEQGWINIENLDLI